MKTRQLVGLAALGLAAWLVGAHWVEDAQSAPAASYPTVRTSGTVGEVARAERPAANDQQPQQQATNPAGNEGGSRETMTMSPGAPVPTAEAPALEVAAR